MPKLTKSVVDAAEPRERQYTLWCSDLKGFGLFVQPSGTRTYFVDYRNAGGARRRISIGRHGPVTAEQARKLAIATLGETVRGADPAEVRVAQKRAITMKELCERYLDAANKGLILGKGNRPKRATTLYTDERRIIRHIIPLLGPKKVADLRAADVNRFIHDVAGGKTKVVEKTAKRRGKSIVRGGLGAATRTTGLLGGILSFAVSEGIIERNPTEGVKRPADNHKRRRLNSDEYSALGAALKAAQDDGEAHQAILGVWLLALTGCRLGEIVKLKWREVDEAGSCFRLDDSKEGASTRPMGKAVFEVLRQIDRTEDRRYVLAPARGGLSFGGMPKAWLRIAKRAGFTDVTPHTLRHSFASTAGDLGYSESAIAAMLGHAAGSVTSRYIHHLDSVLIAAADKVAEHVWVQMRGAETLSLSTVGGAADL